MAAGVERRSARQRRRRQRVWWLGAGAAILACLAVASLAVGSRPVPARAVLDALVAYDPGNDLHLVVRAVRLPRMLVSLLAGAALGVAGAGMQATTRNALAEPGLLGINAGAATAVVGAAALFGLTSVAQYLLFAVAGAGLAGAAVFLLGRAYETGINPVRLLLAGAGISVTLGAVTGIVILNAPPTVFDEFRTWMAGSLERAGVEAVAVLAAAVTVGLATVLASVDSLNAMALGKDLGQALGADPRRTWLLSCLTVMVLAGAATAAVGPIGFVGLIAPHLARAVAGPDHRWILPVSGLFAAILLLGADIAGRVIAAPSELPAGIVTALVGGPFFIVAVRRFRAGRR